MLLVPLLTTRPGGDSCAPLIYFFIHPGKPRQSVENIEINRIYDTLEGNHSWQTTMDKCDFNEPGSFPTTHWSAVYRASGEVEGNRALADLLVRYLPAQWRSRVQQNHADHLDW